MNPPPMEFDGKLYWYVRFHDAADDRCCLCRELIPEDDVPLVLFRDRGRDTLMARIHFEPCAQTLFASGYLNVQERQTS